MKKKILHKLKDYFDKDFRKQLKHEETLKGLLVRLEEKEVEISAKLENCDNEDERKLLKKQLKVLKAQCKKAEKIIG